MSENDDEQIGYGRPPKRTRFQKGRSGNPKGRPKGALDNFTRALQRAFDQYLDVTQEGRAERMKKWEIGLTRQVNDAVKGDLKAMEFVLDLCRKLGALEPVSQPEGRSGVLVVNGYMSEEEWRAHKSGGAQS